MYNISGLTDYAKYESVGEVTVKSEFGNVAAYAECSHGLLQVGQNPVADAHVDEDERHAGKHALAVRVLFPLQQQMFKKRFFSRDTVVIYV